MHLPLSTRFDAPTHQHQLCAAAGPTISHHRCRCSHHKCRCSHHECRPQVKAKRPTQKIAGALAKSSFEACLKEAVNEARAALEARASAPALLRGAHGADGQKGLLGYCARSVLGLCGVCVGCLYWGCGWGCQEAVTAGWMPEEALVKLAVRMAEDAYAEVGGACDPAACQGCVFCMFCFVLSLSRSARASVG